MPLVANNTTHNNGNLANTYAIEQCAKKKMFKF